MDLKEIQAILQNEKGKIIIVENGEPTMVILPYQEYKNGLEERIVNEVPELKESDELTIDDLPL